MRLFSVLRDKLNLAPVYVIRKLLRFPLSSGGDKLPEAFTAPPRVVKRTFLVSIRDVLTSTIVFSDGKDLGMRGVPLVRNLENRQIHGTDRRIEYTFNAANTFCMQHSWEENT